MSAFQPDDFSLPSWAYTDAEFLALERERVFRPSWQIICHVSEIPHPGDYQCFDFIGEMLFALRGNDSKVRAFHNVCRHRGARLLEVRLDLEQARERAAVAERERDAHTRAEPEPEPDGTES